MICGESAQPLGDFRLKVSLRARADLRDDLARADRAHRQAIGDAAPLRLPRQETGGEQVARSGGVDDLVDRLGRHFGPHPARDRERAVRTARDDEQRHLRRNLGDRRLEIVGFGERADLDLVREQYVEQPFGDQSAEVGAVAIDDAMGGGFWGGLATTLYDLVLGMIGGALVLAGVKAFQKLRGTPAAAH